MGPDAALGVFASFHHLSALFLKTLTVFTCVGSRVRETWAQDLPGPKVQGSGPSSNASSEWTSSMIAVKFFNAQGPNFLTL